MTVRHLIAALTAAGVEVDGSSVNWFSAGDDPPDHLLAALTDLGTGGRAVLAGRRWFGIDPPTRTGFVDRPFEIDDSQSTRASTWSSRRASSAFTSTSWTAAP